MSVAAICRAPKTLETKSSTGQSEGVTRQALYALGNGTITGTQTIEEVGTDAKRQIATKDGCFLHADQDLNDDGKTRRFYVALDLLFVALCMKRGEFGPLFVSRRVVHWPMSFSAN
jgi:hypothetical protein